MIVVETGALDNAEANSYVSLSSFKGFLVLHGATTALERDDAELEAALIRAAAHIDTYRAKFLGRPVAFDQPLVWPRTAVTLDGFDVPSTTIPRIILQAQQQRALADLNGTLPETSQVVLRRRERLDVIEEETEYAPIPASARPTGDITRLLSPLFGSRSTGEIVRG
ncbi:hypothetical protein JL100_017955 [Skermanella mucosa]|uniref:DnaT-like ssDNA-binding protein n=1 Tax=Skermanella mucosa TaxID=1789672 RepID=UPI00192B8EF0|nr:DnaT-like ssDNA-binding protein [Skermanella mucosa]UEM18970.1 hypothetical protein JL100_017955 [Skermanella mucosa]